MKKLWKTRCVATWILSAVGIALGAFMLVSYFYPQFRLGYLDFLDPLYKAKVSEFISIAFAVACLFRMFGGLLLKTGILSPYPRFRDGMT